MLTLLTSKDFAPDQIGKSSPRQTYTAAISRSICSRNNVWLNNTWHFCLLFHLSENTVIFSLLITHASEPLHTYSRTHYTLHSVPDDCTYIIYCTLYVQVFVQNLVWLLLCAFVGGGHWLIIPRWPKNIRLFLAQNFLPWLVIGKCRAQVEW